MPTQNHLDIDKIRSLYTDDKEQFYTMERTQLLLLCELVECTREIHEAMLLPSKKPAAKLELPSLPDEATKLLCDLYSYIETVSLHSTAERRSLAQDVHHVLRSLNANLKFRKCLCPPLSTSSPK